MKYLIKDANDLYNKGQFSAALQAYEKIQWQYPQHAKLFDATILLCKKNILRAAAPLPTPDIYITLTTISDRLKKIKPVLESLHKQQLKPKKIILNLSEQPYLLDKGIEKNNPLLAELKRLPLVEINWTDNTGPYRKILPFLKKHFDSGVTEDKLFITVDDDTLYPNYFIQALYEQYILHNCIVGFRGRHITLKNKHIDNYVNWKLGTIEKSMSNLPTGKDGIIYNTKFFTKEFIDIAVAKELAPTADDLWIKWHTGLNGVKSIILNPEAATSDYKSFPVVDYSASYRNVSLFKAHNSNDAGGKNDLSVKKLEDYFQKRYGYNLATLCLSEGA